MSSVTKCRLIRRDDPCLELRLGLVAYQEAWELQRALAEARQQQGTALHPPAMPPALRYSKASASPRRSVIPDMLLLLEHPHVYTLGRRGDASDVLLSEAELRERGVEVRWTDRGGQTTYHGPGQLVAYGIVDVRRVGGPAAYVCGLEEVVIEALGEYGIAAERIAGLPGVWARGEKVAAVGVRVSSGVTAHGLALNVAPDLSYFEHIVPCGVRDRGVTSMARLLGREPSMAGVQDAMSQSWGGVFGHRMQRVEAAWEWVQKHTQATRA